MVDCASPHLFPAKVLLAGPLEELRAAVAKRIRIHESLGESAQLEMVSAALELAAAQLEHVQAMTTAPFGAPEASEAPRLEKAEPSRAPPGDDGASAVAECESTLPLSPSRNGDGVGPSNGGARAGTSESDHDGSALPSRPRNSDGDSP